MSTLPARNEVDPRHTWNLESLYSDEAAYDADLKKLDRDIAGLAGRAGTLGESGSGLLGFLEGYFDALTRIRGLALYANLPVATDVTDQAARARAGRFAGLVAGWTRALSFVDPELLALGAERLAALAAEESGLKVYERAFEKLEARRPHVRSGEVEELLGSLGDVLGGASRAHGSLVNGELHFESVSLPDGTKAELAPSSLKGLIGHTDRAVRKEAFENYTGAFLSVRNTLAELYLTRVKQSAFSARTRSYPSTVEEALSPNEVPRAALEAVVRVFERRVSVWHRYWAVRRRILGVEKLEPWDVFAPLVSSPPEIPYDQSCEWIVDAVAPLGEAYATRLAKGLADERWVDIYPNRGKRDGAFAAGAPGTQPFIMMSYDDGTSGMSTLAHELGHAMHGQLTYANQPLPYCGYSMVVAETASNLLQALLFPHLLEKSTDRNFQVALLEEALYNLHRYFFIMPTLARFELAVHGAVERGEGLTADHMGGIMADLFREGYGAEMDVDERTGITWATFGHLYIPFYTFQYSCGISAAAALAADLRSGKPGAQDAVLGFLKVGNSLTPMETLQRAGVDLTSDEPFEKAFDALEEYLDRLEELAAAG